MRFCCILIALACSPTSAEPLSERCERLGDRCRLRDGLLGICSETRDACEAPPCLRCTPQH